MSQTLHISFDPLSVDLFTQKFDSVEHQSVCYIFQDYLNEGALRSDIVVNFDQVRAEYFYKNYQLSDRQLAEVPTTEKDILQYSSKMSNGAEYDIVLWMGNNELDVIGYYFILHYLKKHAQKISIVNISGLPFINEQGKLFFPKRVSELDVKSLDKALLLKRPITPTEIELDSDEWKSLRDENAAARVLSGNKKVKSVTLEELHDTVLAHYVPSSRLPKNVSIINERMNAVLSDRFIARLAFELGLTKKDKSKVEIDQNQSTLDL